MAKQLADREPDQKQSISVYFGKTPEKGLELLASRLFKLFPAPFLRADFVHTGAWQLQNVSPLSVKDIPETERDFAEVVSSEYFAGKKLIIPKRPVSRYDLAILLDPEEARPPSNARAIKRCIKAAETLGVGVECITREDSNRLSEFDALFIRETTNVDHHTYRMSADAILGKRDFQYGVAFYGEPTALLADYARGAVPRPDARYAVAERGEDTIIAEVDLPILPGGPKRIWAKAVALRDETGHITGAIESIRDVTERHRTATALRESEAMFRRIVETANEGVWVFDVNYRTTFVNQRMVSRLSAKASWASSKW